MRTIEEKMCKAIKARKNFKSGNTRVEICPDKTARVYLHGNMIYAESIKGWRVFTLAGWNTQTTRSRLRACGVDIRQKNFTPVYNGRENDENELVIIK